MFTETMNICALPRRLSRTSIFIRNNGFWGIRGRTPGPENNMRKMGTIYVICFPATGSGKAIAASGQPVSQAPLFRVSKPSLRPPLHARRGPMRVRSCFGRILTHSFVLSLLALLTTNPVTAQESGVRAGDKVTIDFYTAAGNQLREVAGERIVDRDGDIFLPFVGTVHVEELTARDIRELLTQRFSAFFSEPVVEVTVEIKVNVTGAVARPGSFFVDPSSTVIDALSGAGGTGTGLDLRGIGAGAPDAKNVRLVRDGVTRILNLDPLDTDRTAVDMPVQSGDWLHVPPMPRSRMRENVQFWGTVVSLTAGVVGIIILIAG